MSLGLKIGSNSWKLFFSSIKVFICFILLSKIEKVGSIKAKPSGFWISQSGGSSLKLHTKGDIFCNWLEDEHGFVVVKSKGEFYFANGQNTNGKLSPSEFKVGQHDPHSLNLDKSLRPKGKHKKTNKRGSRSNRARQGDGRQLDDFSTGTLKNLVIPILFNDHQNRNLPTREDIELLWNAPNGHPSHYATGNMSIRDYYLENSYGQLDITSTVVDWVLASQSESYYAAGESGGATELMELLNEVLNEVDQIIDFSEFDENEDGMIDAIAFVHSGYGAESPGYDAYNTDYEDRIWSHEWSIFDITTNELQPWVSAESVGVEHYHLETILDGLSGSTISTIAVGAHETGHFLGLPDLYDTDGSSSGIDSWGLMGNSWGWDNTGNVPPSLSAWCKYLMGWIQPMTITGPGTYHLKDVETHPEAFMLESPYAAGEYLIIENRQPKRSDRQMPQGGVLIWHIDESAYSGNDLEGYWGQSLWPENGLHYILALLQADGNFDLEKGLSADVGDLFSGPESVLYNSYDQHPSSLGYQYGQVVSTELEFKDFTSGEDGTFSFTVSSDKAFSMNSTAGFECNDLLSVNLYDSWGDGWQGTAFSLYSMPGSEELQYVTLYTGSFQEQCLNVELDSCYLFSSSIIGSWTSEISWELCGFTGDYQADLTFCIDADGNCNAVDTCAEAGGLSIYLHDLYGDGWNGLVFGLHVLDDDEEAGPIVQTVTLDSGFSGAECLTVEEDSCYLFEATASGSYDSESYWQMCDQTGYADTSWKFCIDGKGQCYTPAINCSDSFAVMMYDSWGDGWQGTEFSLFSSDGFEELQTVSLGAGSFGKDCLDVEDDACYYFFISKEGSWTSEISWELCGSTGGIDSFLHFCLDDGVCTPVEPCEDGLPLFTFDGSGNGWEGTTFSLYEEDETSSKQDVTLSTGAFGFQCISADDAGKCYMFKASEIGSHQSEISWELCGETGYSFTALSFCLDDDGSCYVPELDCSNELSLTLHDSYGDGWEGTIFSLYSSDGNSLLQSVTIMDGASLDTCLDVEGGSCYSFALSELGSWASEVSWDLCGVTGDVNAYLDFCIEDDGTCTPSEGCSSSITLNQYDSYGDGWNGFFFSLYSTEDAASALQTVTLAIGTSGERCLDVEAGSCYIFSVSDIGTWSSELSWDICGMTGYYDTQLSFCLDDNGHCTDVSTETIDVGSGGDSSTTDCEEDTLVVTKMDSYGDGWNGYYFGLYLVDDTSTALQTMTLDSGMDNGQSCLDIELNSCYIYMVSTVASWGSEISWEICDTIGYYNTQLSFCIDDEGSCYDISTETVEVEEEDSSSFWGWWSDLWDSTSNTGSDSCQGMCGDSPGSCYCDTSCISYGDCCSDACSACNVCSGSGGGNGGGGTDTGSCQGNCGNSAGSCYCDDGCVSYGDCCDDACSACNVCDSDEGGGTGTGSCQGNCGNSAGSCYCDDGCISYGDCCDDACSACNVCDSGEGGESGAGSCQGNCGNPAGSCYCDDTCVSYGDCCGDACSACNVCDSGGGGGGGDGSSSCVDNCGYSADSCFCDSSCLDSGDCCDDACTVCGLCSGSSSPSGGPSSCIGNCGFSADTCFCDDSCVEYGDCCDDACSVCGLCE